MEFSPGIFERILPLAAPNNLRLIVLNRRGYPDSTPYTAEETDDLVSGGKIFLETVGLQVSQFLNAFLDRNDIPQASPDRKSGGLALLGWSQGACWALAPLGQSDVIPKSYLTRLEPYPD
jgi:pimeloyl-ACP methyl ester carboxylesterase